MSRSFIAFAARRGVAAIVFVLLVASAAFFLVQAAPGDAATHLELSSTDPEAATRMRVRLGLDRPVSAQFVSWLRGLLSLDLGSSATFERPVSELVGSSMMRTAQLASFALLLATLAGIPAGILTASIRRRWAALPSFLSLCALACPPIVATLALMLLGARTGWLSVSPGSIALPALALALPMAAVLERLQSRATAGALTQPDIVAAMARGIPRRRLIWVHAFRTALTPVLGVYGLVMAALFSGSVAVETMTSWPGLGQLAVRAVVGRDLFLVTGCALAVAALIAAAQFTADVLRALVDPRVRDSA